MIFALPLHRHSEQTRLLSDTENKEFKNKNSINN